MKKIIITTIGTMAVYYTLKRMDNIYVAAMLLVLIIMYYFFDKYKTSNAEACKTERDKPIESRTKEYISTRQKQILVITYLFFYNFGIAICNRLLPNMADIYQQTVVFGIMYMITWGVLWKYLLKNLKRIAEDVNLNFSFLAWDGIATLIMYIISNIFVTVGSGVQNINEASLDVLIDQDVAVYFLFAIILVPLIEEMFFRNLVFNFFRSKFCIWAHIFTGILFGIYHVWVEILINQQFGQIIHSVPYMILGLGLSIAYQKTNNIFVPVLMHVGVNLFAFI